MQLLTEAKPIMPIIDLLIPGPGGEENDELKRLRSVHPSYAENIILWNFYLSSYEGGPAFAKEENLHKHAREDATDFTARVKRIHYINHIHPMVDYFTDFLYGECIQRDGKENSDFCNSFWKNVDRRGSDITTFMRSISDESQIFGSSFIIVDAPQAPISRPLTKAEEAKLGVQPYWVRVRPQEILDWVRDEFGNYSYVKRKQSLVGMVGGKKVKTDRYTEWTSDTITVTDVDTTKERPIVKASTTIPNPVNVVPVVNVMFAESKIDPEVGISFLRDISCQAREVMNLTSLLQEFLYRQCFNMLAMEDDPNLPEGSAQEGTIGTANMLRHPKGSQVPAYITPPVEPAAFLQEERARLISEMYRCAAQNMVNELSNGGKASGMSKAMSFSTTVPKIATRADTLEHAEVRVMTLTMMFISKTWGGEIKYKDHYELTNLTDALTQLTLMFRDLGMPSKTFAALELKRMVHQFDGKFSVEEVKKIEAEIDAMFATDATFTGWLDKIFTATKPSPAAQQKDKQSGTMAEVAAESNKIPTATNKLRPPTNTQ